MRNIEEGATTPPVPQGTRKLVWFAREIVRIHLSLQTSEETSETAQLFRSFRVSTDAVAKQLRQQDPQIFSPNALEHRNHLRQTLRTWITAPSDDIYPLAELAALFRLTEDDVELLAVAAAPAIDPSILQLYSFLWNDIHKRCADAGFLCQLLSAHNPSQSTHIKARFRIDAPLRSQQLLLMEKRRREEDSLDLNLMDRRVRVADRVISFLEQTQNGAPLPIDEDLAEYCARLQDEPPALEDLPLGQDEREIFLRYARTKTMPLLLEGSKGVGKRNVALSMASLLGKNLLWADLSALLALSASTLGMRLAQLVREARLGGDIIYLEGHKLPEHISGPQELALRKALQQQDAVLLGTDELPMWAVNLTSGWASLPLVLPDETRRLEMWESAFAKDRRAPEREAIELIARRYQLSAPQILQAATEARRKAMLDRKPRVGLIHLDRACRSWFAHQLSDVAQVIPPSPFKASDLILPPKEQAKFDEILLYAREHDAVYQDWGFAEKFPYGRGLSVLFYGPPGTGKTMAALIIANCLGLDLYRVDLSRIMSRYVGETEKNLARVFDEAERGKVMLLFDEADSLFTKRTEVKSSVDRYANLEVTYLLQRMENFEGVTVLTTNVEANLDDAFKRRLRYRVYFSMPDAPTRATLWKALIPSAAPTRPDIPFKLLGKHFELSGGHIKQAVLRAGFYARRERETIGLKHLLHGALEECRELGMLVSEDLPKALAKALQREEAAPLS